MPLKSFKAWLPFILASTLAVGMIIGFTMRDNFPHDAFFTKRKANPIEEVLRLIDERYVDDLGSSRWQDSTLDALLQTLDPHSFYISPADMALYNEDLTGHYSGIGVTYDLFNDSLRVLRVLPNSPASRAGLQKGDIILQADTFRLSGVSFPTDSISKVIKGPQGSTLKLMLTRAGKPQTISVKREEIPINTVEKYYMVNATTGYIAIDEFNNHTYRNFMLALTDLQKKGLQSLILDLRGNGGGLMEEATNIADEFIAGERLITYTEGRKSPKKEYRCKRPGEFEKGKLVVLCDEESASASEVLLGALQDWKRASIVGRSTFGKGLVQEQYNLSNGGGIRLTIARYYTPNGRSIQRPYQNKTKEEYYALRTEGDSGASANPSFGIKPDVLIPEDSIEEDINSILLYPTLEQQLSHFAFQWVINHASLSKTYATVHTFLQSFVVTDEMWSAMKAFVKNQTPMTDNMYDTERIALEKRLKIYFALHLWSELGQRMAINETDPVFQQALKTLN